MNDKLMKKKRNEKQKTNQFVHDKENIQKINKTNNWRS